MVSNIHFVLITKCYNISNNKDLYHFLKKKTYIILPFNNKKKLTLCNFVHLKIIIILADFDN